MRKRRSRAAIREAYEECGLRIRLTSRLGAPDEFVFAEDEAVFAAANAVPSLAPQRYGKGPRAEADHELI